jgi:hypothetical protein
MSDLNWKERLPKHHNGKYINNCMVFEFAGYVSRCWDSEGIFESGKAEVACANLISYLGSELPDMETEPQKLINLYKENFLSAQIEAEELHAQLKAKDETIEKLRKHLKFYADGEHFSGDEWENPSGEPLSILCWNEEPFYIEDGGVARQARKELDSNE